MLFGLILTVVSFIGLCRLFRRAIAVFGNAADTVAVTEKVAIKQAALTA